MVVETKICGIRDVAALEAAIAGGAAFFGLVFYPASPRAVSADEARRLVEVAGGRITPVGVFVDASFDDIAAAHADAAFGVAQLHGSEPAALSARIRQELGIQTIKAIPVAEAADLDAVAAYNGAVDYVLFDAKPHPGEVRPGGNARAFDWTLLMDYLSPVPWILSGGLDTDCLEAAVRISGARMVDVSSGVENAPGQKSVDKIGAFLSSARAL